MPRFPSHRDPFHRLPLATEPGPERGGAQGSGQLRCSLRQAAPHTSRATQKRQGTHGRDRRGHTGGWPLSDSG